MSTMRLEKQENVYLLTLTNSERANTLTDAVLDEYHAALDEVEAGKDNAALVIASADPKFFSNGIDLEYIQSKGMQYLFDTFGARLDQLLLRVALLNLPTVACVTGHAYGGGALLASATTVQPAASAAPALRVNIAAGKFHGVISAATPSGWRRVNRRRSVQGEGTSSP